MVSKTDDLRRLMTEYKTMNIEDLKENINHLYADNDCFNQHQLLEIAKNELKLKYQEREEQIVLLTKSLSSSSRIKRWISSIKEVIKQFIHLKN